MSDAAYLNRSDGRGTASRAPIRRLWLASPLIYLKERGEPFGGRKERAEDPFNEELFCFEINPSLAAEFEPDKDLFLGPLIFSGRAAPVNFHGASAEKFELPRGNYLFSQVRAFLNAEEILELAIELQKEALWQRLEPGKLLYLRYLTEDGSGVTQILRPCTFEVQGL